MGRSYWYECLKCGYRAKVSGGADRGYDVAVQTIECTDCRELYDAVVRLRVPEESPLMNWRLPPARRRSLFVSSQKDPAVPPSFAAALNHLPARGVPRFRWIKYKLQCPVSSIHRVTPWNDPARCPKCDTFLERSALPFRIWE